MYKELNISDETVALTIKAEESLKNQFNEIDEMCDYNSLKVLNAFHKNKVSEVHFGSTTGYGYNDNRRKVIDKVVADVLGAEDSWVRSPFIAGTHALTVALFAFLRPGDLMLSITGKPYDTLDQVIGIVDNSSSLKSFTVEYEQIDLIADDFDYDKIKQKLTDSKIKLIEIQRSKGYSTRKSISLEKLKKVVKLIRSIDTNVIIMVDNCYCEFIEDKSPLEVGADIIVGSLIKNLGGGIAPNGAYIAGRKDLIELAGERLTVPGEGKEVGPSLGINKYILQGLFLAPSVVASSLKTALLASKMLEDKGYKLEPKYNDKRVDIVQTIECNDKDKLIKYCQGIQMASPIDSFAIPEPGDMPGYQDQVIMASGSFTQGSSIELSCDGPLRHPYVAYMQGGLTYQYGKLGVMKAIDNILK
jgi:cystathionine beta-lyase family protein involved in aluminum resistance